MSRTGRWSWLGVGLVLLVAVPLLVRARPVPGADVDAVTLLQRIRESDRVALTGYAETRGFMSVPSEEGVSSLAEILGDRTAVRVWWAGPDLWRTATLRTTGETDRWHRDGETVRWVYESRLVTVSPDVPVRLPMSVDVLPPVLARTLLDGAGSEEVARIGEARVAGRATAGLRLTPSDPRSSIGHVDVWADPSTGVPLRVLVSGDDGRTALTSAFEEVTFGRPGAEVLSFHPPPDASVRYDPTVDLAAAADRYADRDVPGSLAGLPGRVAGVRSVGVYGQGPTLLLALPVRDDDARRLRAELRGRPGSTCLRQGWAVSTGPLQMMVTATGDDGAWLLAGTVTRPTVEDAAASLTSAEGCCS